MFKKVDSFVKRHHLSRTRCVSVCADGASAMMRTKKIFSLYENGKKNIEAVIVLSTENKFGSEINLGRSDISFKANGSDLKAFINNSV